MFGKIYMYVCVCAGQIRIRKTKFAQVRSKGTLSVNHSVQDKPGESDGERWRPPAACERVYRKEKDIVFLLQCILDFKITRVLYLPAIRRGLW